MFGSFGLFGCHFSSLVNLGSLGRLCIILGKCITVELTDLHCSLEFHGGVLKVSIRAFDCLNITSTAFLGCAFVTKQGPISVFRHKRSFETSQPWVRSRIQELG